MVQCGSTTPTPTTAGPTTTPGPNQNNDAFIKIVDRIGRSHSVGSMVYAYYDTYKSEYIVLDTYEEVSAPTIYGTWNGSSITVEGTSGTNDITIGSSITVENTLNFPAPQGGCQPKAVATKFLITSSG
jgi:hypothetical protein